MNNFIRQVMIENFKSIQSCYIENCKRINLFIGRPNVGKSNIIEALSLYSLPFIKENSSKRITQFVRIENESELFYNGDYLKTATINIDVDVQYLCEVRYNPKQGLDITIDEFKEIYLCSINAKLDVIYQTESVSYSPIKRYTFNPNVFYERDHAKYLIPPYGHNLMSVIESNNNLKKEVFDLFDEYELPVVFDIGSQTIKIQQVKNGNEVFQIPYSSIADTLQRLIFFKAATASNDDSILLFEEPEAHSFPPYMAKFTQDIINKKNNQFFIATHSPFVLNDLLENAQDELSVYMVDIQNKQTVVKQLTNDQLHEIYQYGVDLFTNSESFI